MSTTQRSVAAILRRILISVAAVVLTSGSCLAAEPADHRILPTVEKVRQHLHKWHQNFDVFRIRYEVTWPESETRYYRDFLMTKHKAFVDAEERFYTGKVPTKSVRGSDTKFRFSASYRQVSKEKGWELMRVSSRAGGGQNIGSTMILHPLRLLFLPHPGSWADEYLFDNDVSVHSHDVVDGEDCVVLDVNYANRPGQRIWLATNKGYLIKKMAPIVEGTVGFSKYRCDEFRRSGQHWYPYRGQNGTAPDQRYWKVETFEVNMPLDWTIFVAPPQPLNQFSSGRSTLSTNTPSGNTPSSSTRSKFVAVAIVAIAATIVLLFATGFRIHRARHGRSPGSGAAADEQNVKSERPNLT